MSMVKKGPRQKPKPSKAVLDMVNATKAKKAASRKPEKPSQVAVPIGKSGTKNR